LADGLILRVVVLVVIRVPSGDTRPGGFRLPTRHHMKESDGGRPAGMAARRVRSRWPLLVPYLG
jgi:hypothetical protein